MKTFIKSQPRLPVLLITLCLALVLALTACGRQAEPEPTLSPVPVSGLVGMIFDDSGASEQDYAAVYSFLQTAGELSKNAKLYRTSDFATFEKLVDEVRKDECGGLLVINREEKNSEALQSLVTDGVVMITLLDSAPITDASRVIIDYTTHYEDVALTFAGHMEKDGVTGNTILVCGENAQAAVEGIEQALSQYDGILVDSLAGAELTEADILNKITQNEGIAGVFVTDGSAGLAVDAVNNSGFDSIMVIGTGMPQGIEELLKNGLYATCIEPVYDVAVQATYMLCGILDGTETAQDVPLTMYIVTEHSIAKHLTAISQALSAFGLQTPTPPPEGSPSFEATEMPQITG